MNLTSMEWTLLAVAVLLLASVLASKVSDRLGIPSLLIFLGIGMLMSIHTHRRLGDAVRR